MSDFTEIGPNRLRRNSLGLIAVTFMVVSAAAPLTGVAGAMPIAFLAGNGAGIPATFVFITLVMLAFSVGYVAMSRHVANAGAFYAYAARGLGGGAGGAVSMIAIVAYNAMQVGLLGLLGGVASGVFGEMGLSLPWWGWSLIAIALVAVLGYRQVDLSAKVLIVLVALEYLIVLLVAFAILLQGGAAGLSIPFFDWPTITSGSVTLAILLCLGSFIGFEATTIYSEEARDPERTIPRATYLSVLMIGVFFVFTTWLLIAGAGVAELQSGIAALPDPTAFFFELAGRYVGGPVPTIAGILLVSSLFAAVSAFHNYIARYSYVAGREGLLPAAFGRTHDQHQSPHIGSVMQTVTALIVVGVFAWLGLDPILNLFTWVSQLGTLGVLAMMAITSLAIIAFFNSGQASASPLAGMILPAVSGVIMAGLFVYIFVNFGDLTGTTGGSLGWILPSLIPLAGIVGFLLASRLKSADPQAYARMGQNQA
jgi:amino acid transporter